MSQGELPRDEGESGFTGILRRLGRAEEAVLAVVFVDQEGECIDYASALDPYDAKVAGAHLTIVLTEVRQSVRTLRGGECIALQINGSERELLARRVTDEYSLVVVVRAGGTTRHLLDAVEICVSELRKEAGLAAPPWDPAEGGLDVGVRDAVGWEFAPDVVFDGERFVRVADVLGRWEEPGGAAGSRLICFRVITEEMDEMTLAYDEREERWLHW